MSCWVDKETAAGVLAAGLSDNAGPWIVIHVDALSLSDDELAYTVRECGDTAWYANALEIADHLLISNRDRRIPIIPDYAYTRGYKPLLERFIDRDPIILEALSLFTVTERREAYRAEKPSKRSEIRRNYERLFMTVGRRDGFHCANCWSTTGLQIDHRHALANGGTNDLENLQLLCGPCNGHKGDK